MQASPTQVPATQLPAVAASTPAPHTVDPAALAGPTGVKRKRDRKAPYDQRRELIQATFADRESLSLVEDQNLGLADQLSIPHSAVNGSSGTNATIKENGQAAVTDGAEPAATGETVRLLSAAEVRYRQNVERLLQHERRRVRRMRRRSPSPQPDEEAIAAISESFRGQFIRMVSSGGKPNLTTYLGEAGLLVDPADVPGATASPGKNLQQSPPKSVGRGKKGGKDAAPPEFGDDAAAEDIWAAYLRASTRFSHVFPDLSLSTPLETGSETEALVAAALADGRITVAEYLLASKGTRVAAALVGGGTNNVRQRKWPSLPSWAHPVSAHTVHTSGLLPSSHSHIANVIRRAAESETRRYPPGHHAPGHGHASQSAANHAAPLYRAKPMLGDAPGRPARLPLAPVSLEDVVTGQDDSAFPVPWKRPAAAASDAPAAEAEPANGTPDAAAAPPSSAVEAAGAVAGAGTDAAASGAAADANAAGAAREAPLFFGGAWSLFPSAEEQALLLRERPDLFELMDSTDWAPDEVGPGLPPTVPRNERELRAWTEKQYRSHLGVPAASAAPAASANAATPAANGHAHGESAPADADVAMDGPPSSLAAAHAVSGSAPDSDALLAPPPEPARDPWRGQAAGPSGGGVVGGHSAHNGHGGAMVVPSTAGADAPLSSPPAGSGASGAAAARGPLPGTGPVTEDEMALAHEFLNVDNRSKSGSVAGAPPGE